MMTMPSPSIPKEIVALLRAELQTNARDLLIEEVTAHYPWVKRHSLYLGRSPRGSTLTVAQSGQAPPFALGGQSGPSDLSALLVHERGSMPGGLGALELALAIRRLSVGPRGSVGEPGMLTRIPIPASPSWCSGDSAEQERLRELMCHAPDLEEHDGSWELRFFYWNPEGGVELWSVTGDSSRIGSMYRDYAAPNGSFLWPRR